MAIVLMILKIIGIVIAVLLGILLLLICLVLFVPIRYRIDGTYQEAVDAQAKVSWLLHLLSVCVSYHDALTYTVKVVGIRFLPKKKKEKKSKKRRSKKESSDLSSDQQTSQVQEESGEGREDPKAHVTADAKEPKEACEPQETHKLNQEEPKESASEPEKKSLFEKISDTWHKIKSRIWAICDKIKNIRDTVAYYGNILMQEDTQNAFHLAWEQIRKILKSIWPRKIRARFIVGMEDPAATGQIMAVRGMLFPLIGNEVCILPDFEEERLEGDFHIKGRITLFMIAICGLRVILNKDVRKLIKLLRNKEEVS